MILESVWDVLIPLAITAVLINVIPFVIHLRLGNWPGIFMSLLIIFYGLLVATNGMVNRNIPLSKLMLLPQVYWFCSIYDIGIPLLQVATVGCSLRLLAQLLVVLQKSEAAQQQYTQHHYSTATIFTQNNGTLAPIIITTNTTNWKKRISNGINQLSLWHQDHQQHIWDIVLIWILPILYMALIIVLDLRYSKKRAYYSIPFYLTYSSSAGCVPHNVDGHLASTIHYIYPLILAVADICYIVLITIKIVKVKSIFSTSSSVSRSSLSTSYKPSQSTFYRLYIFCCLYSLLYILHLPTIIKRYMSTILDKEVPWAEQDIFESTNGLTFSFNDKNEVINIVAYPILSFTWPLFTGTTQEAYNVYATLWQWIIQHRQQNQQQQQQDDDDDNDDDCGTYIDPLLSRSSTISFSPIKDYVKHPPPASLRSSFCRPYAFSIQSKCRHDYTSTPSLLGPPKLFARHSIHSSTGTVSSRMTESSAATLVNPP
ncbi:hypothetical protein BC941DRAFT_466760 [Chlamydoabsidia padenii]|nr:hypothetical protein BC941DRAFT_466760 [Chlamydoabsidia padenii]